MSALAASVSLVAVPRSTVTPGSGWLQVSRVGPRSVAQRAFAVSPLRLLTPGNRGAGAWVYASSLGGGLIGGDEVSLDVEVGPGATAVLLSQSSMKVYRSTRLSTQILTARVASAGTLLLLPEPVTCFAGSRFRQRQRIDLADDASLLVVDTYTSGRASSGERWLFDHYESRIEVARAGKRLVYEAVRLDAEAGDLGRRQGRFDAFCLVILSGPAFTDAATFLLADVAARPIERRASLLVVASALSPEGAIVRIAGTSVERVARFVRQLLAFVPELLRDDPWERKQ